VSDLQTDAEAAVLAALATHTGAERFAFLCEVLKAASLRMVEQGAAPTVCVQLVWPHASLQLFSSDRS
jgi:hypothetical protein